MVFQHFMLADNLTVLENVVLGAEGLHGIGDRARDRVETISGTYGFGLHPDQLVEELGVGERQRVEILKVLYRGARILILDEPTAVLVPQEVDELFANLRELKSEGITILFISHKLDEVRAIAEKAQGGIDAILAEVALVRAQSERMVADSAANVETVVAGERRGIGSRQRERGARQPAREGGARDDRDGGSAKACRHREFLSGVGKRMRAAMRGRFITASAARAAGSASACERYVARDTRRTALHQASAARCRRRKAGIDVTMSGLPWLPAMNGLHGCALTGPGVFHTTLNWPSALISPMNTGLCRWWFFASISIVKPLGALKLWPAIAAITLSVSVDFAFSTALTHISKPMTCASIGSLVTRFGFLV